MTTSIRDTLLRQLDIAWRLMTFHLRDLSTAECLWQPARTGLQVRERDGGRRADWTEHENYALGPPTIAWLTWHAEYRWSMALDYSFGPGTLRREVVTWPGDADGVRARLGALHDCWDGELRRMSDDDVLSAGRTKWPFADRPFADVCAWANLELMKNAAEIGYARFLYAARSDGTAGQEAAR